VNTDTPAPSVRRARLLAGAAAILLPLLLWAVVDPLLGHRLVIVEGQDSLELGAEPMLVVSTAAVLLGWASLALLERLTRAARWIWLALALGVLAVSFLPLTGGETETVTRLVLAAAHLLVAAALIPAFVMTSPRRASRVVRTSAR
jgi:hypothetical protein